MGNPRMRTRSGVSGKETHAYGVDGRVCSFTMKTKRLNRPGESRIALPRFAEILALPLGRLLVAVMLVTTTYALSTTWAFQTIENRLFDYGVSHLARMHAPHPDVVVVAIDEHSLERMAPTLGRWPWPRAALASVIDYCSQARVIGFDVLYSERDWQYERSDAVFVDMVGEVSNVVSAIHLGTAIQRNVLQPSLQRFSMTNLVSRKPLVSEFNAVLAPFDALLKVTSGVGHVNPVIDEDGVVRRYAAVGRASGAVFPSMALAAAAHYLNIDTRDMRVDPKGLLSMGENVIPLNEQGEFVMVPSAREHRHYRIADIIRAWQLEREGEFPPISRQDFKGKVVLIGSLATGLFEDTKTTPVSRAMDGVHIIATATENLINADMLYRP